MPAEIMEISAGTQFLNNPKMSVRAFGDVVSTCWALEMHDVPLAGCGQALKTALRDGGLAVNFCLVRNPSLAAQATLVALLASKQTIMQLYAVSPSLLITLMRAACTFRPVQSCV